MCGQISWTQVGLCLDDAANPQEATVVVDEMHADEITCDRERVARIESATELAPSGFARGA
jgi:hypothetical protein